MAAVLACGAGSLLRGNAAGHLERLLKRAPTCPEVLTTTERRIPGIRTTRARAGIDPREATIVRGIPVTSVPRTLVDLAAGPLLIRPRQGLPRGRLSPPHHAGPGSGGHRAPPQHPRRQQGSGRILTGDEPVSLSRLEARFLSLLLAQNNLPLPITNKPAGGKRVDCRWPEHRLTVELDSYAFHNSRHSWEADRRRRAPGLRPRRRLSPLHLGRRLRGRPRQMLRELRALTSA